MDIVVLAGGLSPERDVSLSSGALIANALVDKGHRVQLVDLFLGPVAAVAGQYRFAIPETAPDLAALRAHHPEVSGAIGTGVLDLCRSSEVVFVALHGGMGEDGRLQALFDALDIRYTGTGYTGCLLAMDKDLSKRLVRSAGVLTADWVTYDLAAVRRPTASDVRLPCVVKPLGCGSSVGITLVRTASEFEAAMEAAAVYETTILVEDLIEGREFSCGVLGTEALPVIEILPTTGFYDYRTKYQAGLAREVCPAEIPPVLAKALQGAALQAHRILRLGFYSRTDFIVDAQGRVWFLESNTLPGMTPTSLLPQEAAAAGIDYPELCERIVQAGRSKG